MTAPEANAAPCELTLIYMNGSIIPLKGDELVASLRHRTSVLMLVAIAVLLALPPKSILLGDAPLWARVILNLVLVGGFIGLFPALLFDSMERARRAGKRKVHLLLASVPTAILAILATEAIAIILLDGSISRWALLVKLGLGIVSFELVLVVVIWFYGPVIVGERAEEADLVQPTVVIGSAKIVPEALRRIESDGRHLHLHLEGEVQTVTARLRDAADTLSTHGLLVHRCHWVAYAEVGPIRVKGRSYEMTTRQGDSVPVARDRRKAVEMAQDGRDAA